MVILIFNVVLISDKDENAINKGKHVVLFHLSKYSDKLYLDLLSRRSWRTKLTYYLQPSRPRM